MNSIVTVNVQLKLDHKSGGFEDEAAMLRWLQACLNSNSNFVACEASIASVPLAIVKVEEGLIQEITTSAPIRVVILDHDVEGNQEDLMTQIDGEDVIVTNEFVTDIHPTYVDAVMQQLASATYHLNKP